MIVPPPPPDAGAHAPAHEPVASPPPNDRWTRRLVLAREQLFGIFFFVAFIFLLYQLYRVFAFFLAPIVWAAILAMLFFPLYQLVLARLRGRATLAAVVLTFTVTAMIVLPTISLSTVVTRESAGLYRQFTEFVNSGRLNETVEHLRTSPAGRFLERLSRQPWEINYGDVIRRGVDTVSNLVLTQITAVARNIASFLLNFTIMVFTLFFLFRDGERLYRGFRDLVPMDPDHKDAIFYRLYETLSAVMRGMVLTAVAQGVLTWVGLALLTLPYPAFLGVLAAFMSMIPFVGAAGVWIPCTIYLAVSGDLVRAAILLVYGALVISMVDNILRPFVIGGKTRLPTLFLFFGILGGLQAYGVLGIFLGPVLLAIVVAFVKIYREQYATAD